MDKADISWMLVSTLLVLMMAVPGLALFYGGLVRSKNVLSVLMQVMGTFVVGLVLWFIYGYSLAFTEGNAFFGGFSRVFFSGMFSPADGKYAMTGSLTELLFASFQATFAGITCALIVGSFAERARFSAVLLFTVIWFTFAYVPIAHMVWFASQTAPGLMNAKGALDFAGGTVVHINAGIAGLVGAYVIGKRVGYGREAMQPHNLPMVMTGAALLWTGWFGFNAGSALMSNEQATLAFFNTMIATAAAVLAWLFTEWALKGKPSMLGAASGAVAGLVAITPAAGLVGMVGAFVIGIAGGVICVWGVNGLKRMLKADDALDVFGVHGVGGITGALLTGVFNAQVLGGPGLKTAGEIGGQLWVQFEGVVLTLVWSGVVAWIAYKIADMVCGLRVPEDVEREGLDTTCHGESAYHS
ncbi:ammonia channel protein [Bordetella genomosp. 9]|uniref:Ammonium transporter n=2 Tax=Bordetella TaxID=517 RepID=A0A261RG93_9BORD|nr:MULTISPECIES: ammonium transporter [Bordetella]ARP81119.1 ammonia channel protein [Bordetella genomosp. 8]OZI23692.1 ammonia channel protein [Bordetella genomosp. 9]